MSEVQTPAATAAATTTPAAPAAPTADSASVPANSTAAELYQQPASNPQVQTPQTNAAPSTTADPQSKAQELYNAPEQQDQQQGEGQAQQSQIPEQYDFKDVKASNGLAITETDTALVSKIGKTIGLTNEQARKLLEQGGSLFGESIALAVQAQTKLNIEAVQRDPELGGVNYNQTRTNLSRINQRYIKANAEAQKLLEDSGLMYHPAIVRLFNAIGKDIGEEQLYAGNGSNRAPTKVNRLRALYNNSPDMDFGD